MSRDPKEIDNGMWKTVHFAASYFCGKCDITFFPRIIL